MKHFVLAAATALVAHGNIVWAQAPASASDPGNLSRFSRGVKMRYDNIKRDVVEAAEAVPDAEYSFKPTPEVRSFGEIIGHIADTQNYFCAVAAGTIPQYADILVQSAAAKAD